MPIFKGLFKKEPKEIPPEADIGDYLDKLAVFNEDGENVAELMGTTEIYVKSVYPTCLEDISMIEEELKKGNILIVHLTKLYENPRECMRAVEQIRGILNFVGGDMGRISGGGADIIVTPSFIKIWRDE